MLLVEWILGARRSYEGLMIDPCLSVTIPHASIERKFRGTTYQITYDNTAGRSKGVSRITVDGKELIGNILPDFRGGVHKVDVII